MLVAVADATTVGERDGGSDGVAERVGAGVVEGDTVLEGDHDVVAVVLRVVEGVLVLLWDGSSRAFRARFDTNQVPLYAKLL